MSERLLQGLPAAPGAGAGPARVLGGVPVETGVAALPAAERPTELSRALAALALAGGELSALAESLRGGGRAEEAEIVETGVLMAGDPALTAELDRLVVVEGRAAAAALVAATDSLANTLAALDDERLAARAEDVRSLGRRAARLAAAGDAAAADRISPADDGVVLVADDLGPADVAELGGGVAGVALAAGSPTGHAAVVARGLGIPMSVGLGDELLATRAGGLVAVDGDAGTAVLEPSATRIAAARESTRARLAAAAHARADAAFPCVTRDGYAIRVLVNAATAAELERGLEAGAEGVGLLRTELGFLDAQSWPDEQAHRRALAPVLGRLAGRTATVRVLDFGGDKTPPFLRGTELRGLALLLAEPAALAAQLRAIVAEGGATGLRVLLPMAERATEVEQVRRLLPTSALIGAMVETTGAAARARELAGAADFLSIGTNDLTHAVLGTDRFATGAAAAHDPRVLARIAAVAAAARTAGKTLEVCGEAASDPILVPLLLGFGVDELSVGAARVAEVRALVRGIDRGEAQELAQRALEAPDAAAVAALVDEAADADRERGDRDRGVVPVSAQL